MPERSVVELPPEVGEPFEVFLNGVPQQAGRDFRVEGRQLVFERSLAREGRLGFWRWLALFRRRLRHGRTAHRDQPAYRIVSDSFGLTQRCGVVRAGYRDGNR